jgi:hypothetical protein
MSQPPKLANTTASFLLRVWLEPANGDQPPVLRGYIRHVQSDTERYFIDTAAILEFIEDNLPGEFRERRVKTSTGISDRGGVSW